MALHIATPLKCWIFLYKLNLSTESQHVKNVRNKENIKAFSSFKLENIAFMQLQSLEFIQKCPNSYLGITTDNGGFYFGESFKGYKKRAAPSYCPCKSVFRIFIHNHLLHGRLNMLLQTVMHSQTGIQTQKNQH